MMWRTSLPTCTSCCAHRPRLLMYLTSSYKNSVFLTFQTLFVFPLKTLILYLDKIKLGVKITLKNRSANKSHNKHKQVKMYKQTKYIFYNCLRIKNSIVLFRLCFILCCDTVFFSPALLKCFCQLTMTCKCKWTHYGAITVEHIPV